MISHNKYDDFGYNCHVMHEYNDLNYKVNLYTVKILVYNVMYPIHFKNSHQGVCWHIHHWGILLHLGVEFLKCTGVHILYPIFNRAIVSIN